MLVTLSALIVAATMPSLQQSAATSEAADALAPVRRSPVAVTSRDSTRALRARASGARRLRIAAATTLAARDVGRRHAAATPSSAATAISSRSRPIAPEEAPEVVAARARLLTILDSLGAMIPGDRWILGQKVRYLIEAGRPQAADSLGVACAASSDGPRDDELVFRARRLYGAAVRQLSARRRRLHVGARRDARVGSLAMGGSRAASSEARRRTVSARGRRAARLDDGRVLATRPAAVPDERERSAHGVSRAHHADVHRAGQPDRR